MRQSRQGIYRKQKEVVCADAGLEWLCFWRQTLTSDLLRARFEALADADDM